MLDGEQGADGLTRPARAGSNQVIADAAHTVAPSRTDPDGPLPPLLLVLTSVTGVVDAVSYLKLGHVFVGNMTGNIVFLGFAFAGAGSQSIAASLVSLAAFLIGGTIGGHLGARLGTQRERLLTIAIGIEFVLVTVALITAVVGADPVADAAC